MKEAKLEKGKSMNQDIKLSLKINKKQDDSKFIEKVLITELFEWIEKAMDKLTETGLTEDKAFLTMISILILNINTCYFFGELGEDEYDDKRFMKLVSTIFKETAKEMRQQPLFDL